MAFLFSKILPLVVLPLGLSFILLLVGLIARWRWPVISVLLLLWVFSLGLVSQGLWRWLTSPLAASRTDGGNEGRRDCGAQWRTSSSPRCCSGE